MEDGRIKVQDRKIKLCHEGILLFYINLGTESRMEGKGLRDFLDRKENPVQVSVSAVSAGFPGPGSLYNS